jgi:hypothetical protein
MSPIQWLPAVISPGLKQPGHEADHSSQSSDEVKISWIYASTPPIRLHSELLNYAMDKSSWRGIYLKTCRNLTLHFTNDEHMQMSDYIPKAIAAVYNNKFLNQQTLFLAFQCVTRGTRDQSFVKTPSQSFEVQLVQSPYALPYSCVWSK